MSEKCPLCHLKMSVLQARIAFSPKTLPVKASYHPLSKSANIEYKNPYSSLTFFIMFLDNSGLCYLQGNGTREMVLDTIDMSEVETNAA
jgi:hypothetical protein